MTDETGLSAVVQEGQVLGNGMNLDDLYATPVDQSYDTTATLQLALFLMLLTFFLVLTANARFDTVRVGSVIGGVQSAFGFLEGGAGDAGSSRHGSPLPVEREGAVPASGVYADAVEAVFAPMAGSLRVNGSNFDMVVDVSDVFIAGSAASRADRQAVLLAVGEVLAQARTRHLVILVPSAPGQRLDVRRAASIARLLIEGGAPPQQIAVGVSRGTDALMTFRFYQLAGDA
ncbi:MAG: hypothetical protein JJ939_03730 [Alphaproteobacteria bacterium]|nr:hypothetical protein [Alphaproteobacteria bacterium]MBO6627513.1 hypothetical protein [Alphaproteobacteria bacterium]MDF1627156.1 hypothetical protein [Parvibaculaceae bacterium]